MDVNITILVENTTSTPGFIGEYGFAALVTVDGKKFLFDTGSADAFIKNAAKGGIDLTTVNDLVISHGHFDHTSGVIPFLQIGKNKKVYAHSNTFIQRYTINGQIKKEIGVPFEFEEIKANGAELIVTDDFTEISPGVFVTGEIPRINDYEDVGGNFLKCAGGNMIRDNLVDDMSMVINQPEGLIIISGCAHAGIINTITYALQKTGQSKVLAFIGGTHLVNASEERLVRTIAAIKEYKVEKVVACHCTGFNALVKLRNELGDRLIKGETAMSFRF
jgi:7,8-dihydropterin-6-yl-methyl-4-(beta-D-ribofuranosyl)aminobenzene 5'-phosphate synthase